MFKSFSVMFLLVSYPFEFKSASFVIHSYTTLSNHTCLCIQLNSLFGCVYDVGAVMALYIDLYKVQLSIHTLPSAAGFSEQME